MFTSEFREQLSKKLDKAPAEAKDFFIDLMTEGILAGSLSEEHKVEVRIMKASRELKDLLDKCLKGFANPIPPTEEGEKLIQKYYPVRRAYLEWLQLTKAGLESHLQANPIPQISEKFLDEQTKILLENRERSHNEEPNPAGTGS